jgi:hypothetical protein
MFGILSGTLERCAFNRYERQGDANLAQKVRAALIQDAPGRLAILIAHGLNL